MPANVKCWQQTQAEQWFLIISQYFCGAKERRTRTELQYWTCGLPTLPNGLFSPWLCVGPLQIDHSKTVPRHSFGQTCASFASLHVIPFPNAIPAGFASPNTPIFLSYHSQGHEAWTPPSCCSSITLVRCSFGLRYFRNFELKKLQRTITTPEGKGHDMRPAGDLEPR